MANALARAVLLNAKLDMDKVLGHVASKLTQVWIYGGAARVERVLRLLPAVEAHMTKHIPDAWSQHPPSAMELAVRFGLSDDAITTILHSTTTTDPDDFKILERLVEGRTIDGYVAEVTLRRVTSRFSQPLHAFGRYRFLAASLKNGNYVARFKEWLRGQYPTNSEKWIEALDEIVGKEEGDFVSELRGTVSSWNVAAVRKILERPVARELLVKAFYVVAKGSKTPSLIRDWNHRSWSAYFACLQAVHDAAGKPSLDPIAKRLLALAASYDRQVRGAERGGDLFSDGSRVTPLFDASPLSSEALGSLWDFAWFDLLMRGNSAGLRSYAMLTFWRGAQGDIAMSSMLRSLCAFVGPRVDARKAAGDGKSSRAEITSFVSVLDRGCLRAAMPTTAEVLAFMEANKQTHSPTLRAELRAMAKIIPVKHPKPTTSPQTT
jgi:hypothetical protein